LGKNKRLKKKGPCNRQKILSRKGDRKKMKRKEREKKKGTGNFLNQKEKDEKEGPDTNHFESRE